MIDNRARTRRNDESYALTSAFCWSSINGVSLVVLILISVMAWSTPLFASIDLVPKPQHVSVGQGSFTVHRNTRIVVPANPRAEWIGRFLSNKIRSQTGVDMDVVTAPKSGSFVLRISPSIHGRGAYHLDVTPKQVTITAADDQGLFWGVQTLRQLLPLHSHGKPTIPVVHIEDAPRYPWRVVMLDAVPRFQSVSFVEKQIRLMSYYKFNVLHWDLAGQGSWRIQIRQYPKLTSVGAWRTSDGKRHGGFYTQKQIRQIMAYARKRNVMIVPGIEMPGHMAAAIAAYPKLSCSGKPISMANVSGKYAVDRVACAGKSWTYTFLKNVLSEVVKLFPSKYVDIGSDEVPRWAWDDCMTCAKLAKSNGFKDDEYGLHSYFVSRIQKYLASKGKVMMGWDELLDGGINPNAIIEVWHGQRVSQALANGNRIVIANERPFYLSTPVSSLTLKDVYHTKVFRNPVLMHYPHKVLGGEAAVWSGTRVDTLLYPRLLAVADLLWGASTHDWARFKKTVRAQERWLHEHNVAYGHAGVNYSVALMRHSKGWVVHAAPAFSKVHTRYTTNGGRPTISSPVFVDDLVVHAPSTIIVQPFCDRSKCGPARKFRLIKNLVLGKPVRYAAPPAPQYSTDGSLELTNGILGSTHFHRGHWAGWKGSNMKATISLGHPVSIHSIHVRFLQETGAGIVLPRTVRFEASNNGKIWRVLRAVKLSPDQHDDNVFIKDVVYKTSTPITTSFIRVLAINYGRPVHAPVHDYMPWLFCDEIQVQ